MNKFYASKGFLMCASLCLTVFFNGGIANAFPHFPEHKSTPSEFAKKDQIITFKAIANQVYGSRLTLSASSSSGLPVSFKVVSGPAAIAGNVLLITGAGDISISAFQEGDENFNACQVTHSFKGTRKKILVVGYPAGKTYGDADPVFTYTVKPALVEGDSFTGALGRAHGEKVGRYLINIGTLDIKDCYDVDCSMDYMDITSKKIEVAANPLSKLYGAADPVLTYTFSPALVAGDAFQGQLSRSAGELRGVYPILLNSLTLSDNYLLIFKTANFEVIKPLIDLPHLKANNIVTPNGDGKNDYLVFEGIEDYPENELEIFDRASRILYIKKGYDNSFDAKVNGQTLVEGAYYYIMDFGPGKLKLKGFFNVILDKN